MRDTGIANRLRAAGLKVVEIDGWKTRGSETFNPRGSVDHHTAGPRRGNAPSLGICINGRPDLPGPLCHVLVGRDLTCFVIAAGRANHAGPGGWEGLSGNSSVFGVERENVGTSAEPWTAQQTNHAADVHRALMEGRSWAFVCRHAEWAKPAGRKIDTHGISGATLRALVATKPEKPQPPKDELIMDAEARAAFESLEKAIKELDDDLPENANNQFKELRVNVRTALDELNRQRDIAGEPPLGIVIGYDEEGEPIFQ